MAPLAVHYSVGLVALSVLISVLSAYAAFSLAERMRNAEDMDSRIWWQLGGSCAMGAGIWSMHYLGMLAMQVDVEVYYDFPIVLASLLLAIGACAVALTVVSGGSVSRKQMAGGSLLMAGGISGMHYTGMRAMLMSAMPGYSPWVVALSVLAAVVFSWIALQIAVAVRVDSRSGGWMRLAGATVMGLGIASMHYIAMSGMTYMAGGVMPPDIIWLDMRGTTLGGAVVGLTTMCILLTAMGTASLDRKRYRAAEENRRELQEAKDQLVEVNLRLSELSIRDGLTGLHNRRHFDAMFEVEWLRAERTNQALALLLLDVDDFKTLNDSYGHQRGDDCLRAIANALNAGARRGHDLTARLGGDEFVVLLPGADELGARQIAGAIHAALLALQVPNAASPNGVMTVSVGVCVRYPQRNESAEMMMREADRALYAAKRLGRNRIEIADGAVQENGKRVSSDR